MSLVFIWFLSNAVNMNVRSYSSIATTLYLTLPSLYLLPYRKTLAVRSWRIWLRRLGLPRQLWPTSRTKYPVKCMSGRTYMSSWLHGLLESKLIAPVRNNYSSWRNFGNEGPHTIKQYLSIYGWFYNPFVLALQSVINGFTQQLTFLVVSVGLHSKSTSC